MASERNKLNNPFSVINSLTYSNNLLTSIHVLEKTSFLSNYITETVLI